MKTTQWITGLLLTACSPSLHAASTDIVKNTGRVINSDTASVTLIENNSNYHKPLHKVGIDISSAYLLPSHGFFNGENLAEKPIRHHFSAHLKYGFKFAPDTYFGQMYPHATQGIGVAYNTFFNQHELGAPWSVYVFQNSRLLSITRNLSLDYEWNFGASFGWENFNEETNPKNDIVGSKINAYINLGIMLNWRFAPQWNLTAGVGMTHYSNGNTSYPNYGVNTIGGRIGLIRTLGDEEAYEKALKERVKKPFSPYVSYDLVLYGATRKKGIYFDEVDNGKLVPGRFAIAGLNFNPMYNINQYFRTGLSLDIQYDESANIAEHVVNKGAAPEYLKFHRPPLKEQLSAGISVRGEIVMPIFSINVGIGKNFICQGADTNKFYQIFALKTHLTKRAFLHVGYQLYKFKDPNNLMLGIGYRFNGR